MGTGTPLTDGGLFLIQFLIGMVIFILMLRFLLRATHADWRHPIVNFTAKVSNPICFPVNKILPAKGRWDIAALITAFIIQALFVLFIGWMTGKDFGAVFIVIASLTEVANQLLDMMFWLIIIQVILSWVSPQYNPNTAIFIQITEPILAPFRRLIPPVGGMDLSPIFAILAIKLAQIVIVGSIVQFAQPLSGIAG